MSRRVLVTQSFPIGPLSQTQACEKAVRAIVDEVSPSRILSGHLLNGELVLAIEQERLDGDDDSDTPTLWSHTVDVLPPLKSARNQTDHLLAGLAESRIEGCVILCDDTGTVIIGVAPDKMWEVQVRSR